MPKLKENDSLLKDFVPQQESLLLDFKPVTEKEPNTYGLQPNDVNYLNVMADVAKESGVNEGTIREQFPEITAERQWQQSKKIDNRITMRETIERMDGLDWIQRTPFLGPASRGMEMVELLQAVTRLQADDYKQAHIPAGVIGSPFGVVEPMSGESARKADVKLVEDYLLEQQELRDRGQTFGSKVFNGVSYLPGWMIEFFLTGGLSKMGNESAKQIAEKTLKGYAKSKAGRAILRGAGWTGGVITRGTIGMAPRTFEETMTRSVPKQMRFGPNDKLVIDIQGDNWATAILNGYMNTLIETGSEETGAFISKAGKWIGGGVLKRMPFGSKVLPQIQKAWQKLHPEAGAAEFWKSAFSRTGYQGIIGEIGEERLATILKAVMQTETFGLEDDASPWDRLKAGMDQDFQIENLGAELITLSIPGAINFAGGQLAVEFKPQEVKIANRYQKQIKAVEKENLTPKQKSLKKAALLHRMQYELDALEGRPSEEEVKAFEKEVQTEIEQTPSRPSEKQSPTDNDYQQAVLDAGGMEAHETANEYTGHNPEYDLEDIAPNESDINFIKNTLRDLGFRDEGDYEPLNDKDFWEYFKYFQMPDDIRKSFPQFDPVYQVQRGREIQKAVLDRHFAESLQPYYTLKREQRKQVDAVLIEADQNPQLAYGPKRLTAMGLDKAQIDAFLSVRNNLDTAAQMLIQTMERLEIKPEVIEEFKGRVGNYIPHKWYGHWAIVAREKDENGKPTTVFMSAVNRLGRSVEYDRIKQMYPDADVMVIKRKNIPFSHFQEASPAAVQRMIDKAIEKAELDDTTKQIMHQALSDLYKSKGFGMHFIRRKNIPGYSEDLARPIAEYFGGFTGYLTKMEAIQKFPDAIKNIDPSRTPNLSAYAADYIKYVTGNQTEFARAKQAMYLWYLYGNIKSASLNLTQNYVLGWPVLSKQTNLALPKMLLAQARLLTKQLTPQEKAFLKDMEETGHIDPKFSQEISGFVGNPLYHPILGKGKKAIAFADVFRHIEHFNRTSMALALYDSGITDMDQVANLIDEAHFRYGKGNRPNLARGPISPVMTFRSWGINYLTWMKNEIKSGRISPLIKSLTAVTLIGGVKALPIFGAIAYAWQKVFDEDIEAEARNALGKTLGKMVMRGVPSVIPPGISMTGSIGIGDIPTNFQDLGGVFMDIPDRVHRVGIDLKTKQYLRALEDASPESIRNPLSAYRMYTQGMRSRSGRPILDYEKGGIAKPTKPEAIAKGLGFQSSRAAEQWDMAQFMQKQEADRRETQSNFADRFVLAVIQKDEDTAKEVIQEILLYNESMDRKNRGYMKIDMSKGGSFDDALQNRLRPIGIPSNQMMELFWEQHKKYFKE